LLYDEYINTDKTRNVLAESDFFSIMSVLMQLRKVCNHPDLFEARSIESPFILNDQDRIKFNFPTFLVKDLHIANEDRDVNLANLNLRLIDNESKTKLTKIRCQELLPQRHMYETIYNNRELIGSNAPPFGSNYISSALSSNRPFADGLAISKRHHTGAHVLN
jgi:SNF2 family DNA or RNA helicase